MTQTFFGSANFVHELLQVAVVFFLVLLALAVIFYFITDFNRFHGLIAFVQTTPRRLVARVWDGMTDSGKRIPSMMLSDRNKVDSDVNLDGIQGDDSAFRARMIPSRNYHLGS